MPRSQNSPRGLFTKKAIGVFGTDGTLTTVAGNSTGVTLDRGLQLSGQSGQKLTADSTGIIASALRVGSKATYITSNSTGIKIGSRYISSNTTGNVTT